MFNTIRPVILGNSPSPRGPRTLPVTRNLLSWMNPATVYKNTTDKIRKDITATTAQADLCYYKFQRNVQSAAPLRTYPNELFARLFCRYKNFNSWNTTTGNPSTTFNLYLISNDYDVNAITWNTRVASMYLTGLHNVAGTLYPDKINTANGTNTSAARPLCFEIQRSISRSRAGNIAYVQFKNETDLDAGDIVHLNGLSGIGYNGTHTLLSGGTALSFANTSAPESNTDDTGGYFEDDPAAAGMVLELPWPLFLFNTGFGSTQIILNSIFAGGIPFVKNELVGLYAYVGTNIFTDARRIIANDPAAAGGNGTITVESAFTTPIGVFTYVYIGLNVNGIALAPVAGANTDEFELDDLTLQEFAESLEF